MDRLPDDLPGLSAHSESFNATTSDVNLGVQPGQAVGAQTTLAYIRSAGPGESNFGYIWGQTPSASSSGPRFYVFDDGFNPTRRFVFQGHSTGTAGAPGRNTANDSATVGQWFHVAASWDGGLAATGIRIYYAKAGTPLAEETSYTSPTDGTGAVSLGAANEFHIGNRAGTDRTFNGQIAYVARWNRVLSKQELLKAQIEGPDAVPDGLILHRVGGEDRGPFGLTAKLTDVVRGPVPPFTPIAAPAIYAAVVQSSSLIGIGNSKQPTVSGGGAIRQTHLISAAGSTQATTSSGGVAGQDNTTLVTGAPSVQPTVSSGGGINQTHLVSGANSTQATSSSGGVAGHIAPVISDDYERSSVNLAGSSVTGVGDAAVIVIKPRVQESEVKGNLTAWLEPSARISGVGGFRPTFRFSDYAATWSDGKYHGVPWGAGRRPMYSYDRLTWHYFDTQTVAASYIEFRHNTAFTSDTVYISRERQVSVTQIGEWIEALAAAYPGIVVPTAAALAFTPTLTSWPAQAFIADEFSPQTDELGRTIPATPLYAFEINDTSLMPANGIKHVGIMTSGVHAGEDTGTWAMMRAAEYLLGNSAAALYVRKHFRIPFDPMINAPGRCGGGWRGSYTQGLGGADDANRHYNETNSALEIVNKPKAVQTTDRAGVVPKFAFDWHSKFESNWGFFSGSTVLTTFGALLSAKFGTTVDDMGPLSSGGQTEYWRNTVGVPLAMTLEFGNLTPVTDAKYVEFGQAFVESLQAYFQYIEAGSSVQASVSSGGSIQQTHLVAGAGSVQPSVSTPGSVQQTHLVSGASSQHDSASPGGSVSQSLTTFISGADSVQPIASVGGAVRQTHLISVGSSIMVSTSSSAAIKQTHLIGVSDSIQSSQSSGGGIYQAATGGGGPLSDADIARITTSVVAAVWSHESAVLLASRLAEAWGRLGLDPSRPLVQDQTQISFGDVLMALSESSDTVTVTRQ